MQLSRSEIFNFDEKLETVPRILLVQATDERKFSLERITRRQFLAKALKKCPEAHSLFYNALLDCLKFSENMQKCKLIHLCVEVSRI